MTTEHDPGADLLMTLRNLSMMFARNDLAGTVKMSVRQDAWHALHRFLVKKHWGVDMPMQYADSDKPIILNWECTFEVYNESFLVRPKPASG